MTVVVAHAGEGAGWQALLTVVSVGMAVLFVMAVSGRLKLGSAGDLLLPLAGVAVVASLAPIGGDVVSDAAPWAVPAGAVFLVALVLAATTGRELTLRSPLAVATAVAAVALSLAVGPVLVDAWYPDDPTSADASRTVAESARAA